MIVQVLYDKEIIISVLLISMVYLWYISYFSQVIVILFVLDIFLLLS